MKKINLCKKMLLCFKTNKTNIKILKKAHYKKSLMQHINLW